MSATIKSDLEEALKLCKGAFLSAAGFSLLINFLMIAPSIYMLQVYDRVVSTGNKSTLINVDTDSNRAVYYHGRSGVGALTNSG
jgi:ABC-type protease/lipase transport system fused ATPase/permease subunit